MPIIVEIPDDLLERIKPLSGTIEIERICLDAVRAYADSYEYARTSLDTDTGIAEAFSRLLAQEAAHIRREEMPENWGDAPDNPSLEDAPEDPSLETVHPAFPDWDNLGREDAKSWVGAAELEDWDFLLFEMESRKGSEKAHWQIIPEPIGGASNFYSRKQKFDEWLGVRNSGFTHISRAIIEAFDYNPKTIYGHTRESQMQQEYMRAWITYAMAVWHRYCQVREQDEGFRIRRMLDKEKVDLLRDYYGEDEW